MAKERARPKTSLTAEKAVKAIQAGDLQPVYYFHASLTPPRGLERDRKSPFNDYLLDLALKGITKAVVDGNVKDLNYNVFVGGEHDLGTAIQVAETYPMMRPKRLVIVKDAHAINADGWSKALAYLANPAPTTCLVFIGVHLPTQNKGGKAAKSAILESAACVKMEPFKRARDVQPFVSAEFRRRKLKIERGAEQVLLDLLGVDFNEILQAIEKLELFAGESRSVTLADVKTVVGATRLEEIWNLQDSLASRNLGAALMYLGKYLDNAKTEDEIQLIGALIRLYQELIALRRLLDAGLSPGQASKQYPGNPYVVQKRIKQAQGHTRASLAAALAALQDCDHAIRSSRVPNPILFSRFVMKACARPARR